jgi:hypothetical protein
MPEPTQLPKFDAGNWVKVARLAVAVSVALSLVTVAILLTADPPDQCPSWHLKNAHSTSLWGEIVLWAVPMNVCASFIAVCWNWVARSAAESAGRQVRTLFFGPMTPPAIPVTQVMIHMCVVMSLVSQIPLFLLVTQCLIR